MNYSTLQQLFCTALEQLDASVRTVIGIYFYSTPKEPSYQKNGRVVWQEQNIEHSHHVVPIADIEKEFGTKMQFGQVLYEDRTIGTDLVEAAKTYYAQPAGWTETDSHNHHLWMKGRVDGMRDTVDQSLIFERYASDFYARITNYWYWSIHDTFPKPIYLALEEIAEKDLEYFRLVEQFVKEIDRNTKVAVAEVIMQRCFGK